MAGQVRILSPSRCGSISSLFPVNMLQLKVSCGHRAAVTLFPWSSLCVQSMPGYVSPSGKASLHLRGQGKGSSQEFLVADLLWSTS